MDTLCIRINKVCTIRAIMRKKFLSFFFNLIQQFMFQLSIFFIVPLARKNHIQRYSCIYEYLNLHKYITITFKKTFFRSCVSSKISHVESIV